MLTRIRLDAIGHTADDVEQTLYPHAELIEQKVLGRGMSRGECVIERDVAEPDDSKFAWKGRLLLYIDLDSPPGFTVTSSTALGQVFATGSATTNAAA